MPLCPQIVNLNSYRATLIVDIIIVSYFPLCIQCCCNCVLYRHRSFSCLSGKLPLRSYAVTGILNLCKCLDGPCIYYNMSSRIFRDEDHNTRPHVQDCKSNCPHIMSSAFYTQFQAYLLLQEGGSKYIEATNSV